MPSGMLTVGSRPEEDRVRHRDEIKVEFKMNGAKKPYMICLSGAVDAQQNIYLSKEQAMQLKKAWK